MKSYFIFILLFLISCVSNTKVYNKNYDNIWINRVKGKSVVAPNGYLYTFMDNGSVEYEINGKKRGIGFFIYAESETNAYYYEKMSLDYVAHNVQGISSVPKTNISMYVSFVLSNDNLKMTSGYTKSYYNRLSDWKKNNLNMFGALKDGKDMSEYPVPYLEEINFNNFIEFGKLKEYKN